MSTTVVSALVVAWLTYFMFLAATRVRRWRRRRPGLVAALDRLAEIQQEPPTFVFRQDR